MDSFTVLWARLRAPGTEIARRERLVRRGVLYMYLLYSTYCRSHNMDDYPYAIRVVRMDVD